MKPGLLFITVFFSCLVAGAQPKFSQMHGVYNANSLSVEIFSDNPEVEIRYTSDCSAPTAESTRYSEPLTLTKTTVLRAVEVKDGEIVSDVSTASFIFVQSVLNQSNFPIGYPNQWGKYTTIEGRAKADYEMDPEMTESSSYRGKITMGLYDLPILSLVADKDHFFSHENDSVNGGIYIYTGPPVGDGTGHGWTRPANVELIGGPQQHDLSAGCGVRLHGGHGRLAEKNPKHSFRLVFKKQYGPATLEYPVFGADEPDKFDQLVLRCHFGNSWQHWSSDNRRMAQYERDVWMRLMQKRMGHVGVNALYVHLFLNGMYWGVYNVAERVDDQFAKNHFGGKKSDYDVIKVEEDGGNHLEAAEGTLDMWNTLLETVKKADDDSYYEALDSLLDIDNFIDYMIINQYAGNTDWDHHNWYAVRRHGEDSPGFRFLCWDSEVIFVNANENVLGTNNRERPTGIFHNLMKNRRFANRYLQRAKVVLAEDGVLGQNSVVALWDSLYHTIDKALYDEAARWGDYRRDVHRYTSKGELYTVDNHYMAERNRLINNYFPVRSKRVLQSIIDFVGEDDAIAYTTHEQIEDDKFYNLWGQKVEHPARGVFIKNGRKYVFK